jgi:hypothetical protein
VVVETAVAVVEEGVAEGDVDDVAVTWSDDMLMCSCQQFKAGFDVAAAWLYYVIVMFRLQT